MRPLARWAVGLFVAFHGLAVLGSLTRGTALGDGLRTVTRPYEKLLGVYQNWAMFAPNAPRSTRWLEATGQTPDGRTVAVAPLAGPPPGEGVAWRYRRLGKLDRNLLGRKDRWQRKGFVALRCAQAAAAGEPLRSIRLEAVTVRTPDPGARLAGAGATTGRRELETRTCPR